MLEKINLMKDNGETAITFQGYFQTTTTTWAIFDMQWPIKTDQKVPSPHTVPLAEFPPPQTRLSHSSALSHEPLSSSPGSWFNSFAMPSPIIICHSSTFKAIKLLRNLIFEKIFQIFKRTKGLCIKTHTHTHTRSKSSESCHSFALRTSTTTLQLGWPVY